MKEEKLVCSRSGWNTKFLVGEVSRSMEIASKVYEQLDNKSTTDTGMAYTWKDNSTSKDRRFKSRERLSTNHMSEYLL